MGFDEDALICDLAETYQIYDYRSLPASLVATLSAGLRDDSRIKKKLHGDKLDLKETLQASLIDVLLELGYAILGVKGKPPSILDELNGKSTVQKAKETDSGIQAFSTPEELNRKLNELRGGS